MKVKHGILAAAEKDGPAEFWWVGERVGVAEFNRRLHDQTRMVGQDLARMLVGIKEAFIKGEKVAAERELIEKIARGPLCEVCRMMIENMRP